MYILGPNLYKFYIRPSIRHYDCYILQTCTFSSCRSCQFAFYLGNFNNNSI